VSDKLLVEERKKERKKERRRIIRKRAMQSVAYPLA
jgi:hypothetical protein